MERKAQKCKQCGREIYFDGICVSCRAENERNRILAMSDEEVAGSVRQICREIQSTGQLEENEALFRKLLNYREIDTSKIAAAAFEKGLFAPCELYKDAPEDVTKAMIALAEQEEINPSLAGNLLLCLAVRGGDDVFRTFLELEKRPRKWRKSLYVDPSVYAAYGGWSYDGDGRKIKNNFESCYPMVKGTLEEKERSPVKIGVPAGERCPQCDCALVNLMEIDCRDPRLAFLGIDGVIKAKCCPNCFPYAEDYFCRYTIDGESEILCEESPAAMENLFGDEGIQELSSNLYRLGDSPVPLRYAADWEGGSSVGGFGFWIQDCEIKRCPQCGKPMTYLAQIQWDTVLEGMEGNAYIELCKDCNRIAILHQQT